jgi:hypothetical protein
MKSKVLILLGPTRSSTTSLFRVLSSVEGISPSKIKETNFFLNDVVDSYTDEQLKSNFLKNFSCNNGDCLLEASPLYFLYAEKVAPRIMRLQRLGFDVSALVTLREPEDRFWSLYKHILTKRSAGKYDDISDFVSQNIGSLKVKSDLFSIELDFLSIYESCYKSILHTWKNHLGDKSLKVCFFDNLVDPDDFKSEIIELLEWSEIELGQGCDLKFLVENKSTLVRNEFIHKLSLRFNDYLEPFLNKNKWVRDILRITYYTINGRRDELSIPRNIKDIVRKEIQSGNVHLINELTGLCNPETIPDWVQK